MKIATALRTQTSIRPEFWLYIQMAQSSWMRNIRMCLAWRGKLQKPVIPQAVHKLEVNLKHSLHYIQHIGASVLELIEICTHTAPTHLPEYLWWVLYGVATTSIVPAVRLLKKSRHLQEPWYHHLKHIQIWIYCSSPYNLIKQINNQQQLVKQMQ